jgi:hypothetical protein
VLWPELTPLATSTALNSPSTDMETPTPDATTPEFIGPRDSPSQASEMQSIDHPPTPSSGRSSRSQTPDNAPVPVLEVQSQPTGPSQRHFKKKSGLPSVSELVGNIEMYIYALLRLIFKADLPQHV